MTKPDMRSARTRQALKDAMFTLLETENFDQLTINDICMEAAVSRSTFYLHFDDKYDFMTFCIEEHISMIRAHFAQSNLETAFRQVLEANLRVQKPLRRLIRYEGSRELQRKLDDVFIHIYRDYYTAQAERGIRLPMPVEPLAVYTAAGVSSLINWWIASGCTVATLDEMVNYLVNRV